MYMYNDRQLLRYRCLTEAAALLESYQIDVLLEEAEQEIKKPPKERKGLIQKVKDAIRRLKEWFLKTFKKNSVAKEDCKCPDVTKMANDANQLKYQLSQANNGTYVDIDDDYEIPEQQVRKGDPINWDKMTSIFSALSAAVGFATGLYSLNAMVSDRRRELGDKGIKKSNKMQMGIKKYLNIFRKNTDVQNDSNQSNSKISETDYIDK